MLRFSSLQQSQKCLYLGLRGLCRLKSDEFGIEGIKSIKANKWPILTGYASKEDTAKIKSRYLKKRIVNTVPKYFLIKIVVKCRTGWEVSALGYGRGGSRVYNDDWSGEIQRACRFGTNLVQVCDFHRYIHPQITIGEEYLDENRSG